MELRFNVLNSICRVGKQLKNSKLSARAMRHVEKDVKNIASYIDASETQAAIFSLIYQYNYNNCEQATVPDIAQYLSLDTIEMLKYNKDFLQLAQKNICVLLYGVPRTEKTESDKPTNEARMNIWKDKLEILSEDEAISLAERYNFSGGEIDNIVRKLTMRQVIDGSDICIDEIEKLCSHEKLHDEDRRIGFGNF